MSQELAGLFLFQPSTIDPRVAEVGQIEGPNTGPPSERCRLKPHHFVPRSLLCLHLHSKRIDCLLRRERSVEGVIRLIITTPFSLPPTVMQSSAEVEHELLPLSSDSWTDAQQQNPCTPTDTQGFAEHTCLPTGEDKDFCPSCDRKWT